MGINIGLHHFTVAYTTILSRLLFYTIFKNAFLPSPRGCCPRCSFSCTPGIRPQAIRCHSKQRRPGSWCPGDCGVCLQPGQGPGQRRCCCHWRCHCPAGKEERRPRGPRPYLLVELEPASGEARCSCPHQGSYHHCCPSCHPVDWVNTYAFTADPACATEIEVGTYCGFINPDDPCAAQPNAYGPLTTPDTVDAFKNNDVYHKLANEAKTPSGWTQSFKDLSGSVSGSGYLGYYELTSYDTAACAAKCTDTKTCTGFNLFIERDPKWNPRQCSCDKPDSVTRFKCTLWGQDVKKESATNNGQGQDGFEVVIVGSNGYNKQTYTPPTPPSCSKPQSCGKKLHNQQPFCMGQTTFPGPFDPSLCAAYAQKQNEVNRKHGIIDISVG